VLQSGFVIYLLSHAVRDKQPKRSLGHFTIPILSPFSSVVSLCGLSSSPGVDCALQVEQENSLIGTRDADRFSRCHGRSWIFSYSYLAVGPQM
jgi:hypothetical protein